MKILVTGGAGYLGSTLVPALLELKNEVVVLDSFAWRQNSLAHVCASPLLEIVRGDTRDAALMVSLMRKVDAVIPLAALVGAPLCDRDPQAAVSVNRDAIRWIADVLSSSQRLVIPISNSGYGVGEPGKECTEESPLRPVSLYGRTKVEAEQIAMEHPNAVSLRLATVFGMSPRMRLDLLVNDFVYRAQRDRSIVLFEPHFKRNYIHVRDVARAFLMALFDDRMKGGIYNVGLSTANLSKLELCERIKLQVPELVILEAPVGTDPDRRDYIVSNAKIEVLGWTPYYSLDGGITELLKGYLMLRDSIYGNV